jgi:hypothetical protein
LSALLLTNLFEPPSSGDRPSCRLKQINFLEKLQVVSKRAWGGAIRQVFQNVPDTSSLAIAQNQQDSPLPVRQVVAHPQRRMVAAGAEPHCHRSSLFLELRLQLSRRHAPVHNLLRASAPLLDQSTTIEDSGDQRIGRGRGMISL